MEKKKNLKVVELELDGDNLEEELKEALNVIRDEILESIGEDHVIDELFDRYKVYRSWKKEFAPHDIGEAIRKAIAGTSFEYGYLKEKFDSVMMDVFAELFPQEEFHELVKKAQKEEE